MNILIVHNRYQIPGGEDTVFEQETKLLQRHGHHVVCYERSNQELNEMNMMQKLTVPFTMLYSFRAARDIRRLIKQESIDVVHVHNTLLRISPSVYYAAVQQRVPVVQTIHNFRMICPNGLCYRDGKICEDCVSGSLSSAVTHSCYRGSKLQTIALVLSMRLHRMTGIYKKIHYICLTEFNRNQLLKQGQISSEQIFIKPNTIHLETTGSLSSVRRNDLIFAGRLEESKGIRFLLEAWKADASHPFTLKIYGDGPLKEYCEEYIRQNNLSQIELCGRIPHEQLLQVLSESAAFVLPTEWYEGFPMTILEAMANGTPCIVPSLGNAGQIVAEGVSGYHYEPGSIPSFLAALRNDMTINESTVRYFEEHYQEEDGYRTLINIYQTVMQKEKQG